MASKKRGLELAAYSASSATPSTHAILQDVARTIHVWLQEASHDVVDDSGGDSTEEEERGDEQKHGQAVHQDARAQLVRNAVHMLRLRTTRSGCAVARAFVGLGSWLLRPLSRIEGAWRLPDSWAQPSALQVWKFLGAWNDAARVGVIVANGCASRTWRRVLSSVATRRVCQEVAMIHAEFPLCVRREAHTLCWSLLNDENRFNPSKRATLQLVPHVVTHLVACPTILLPIEKTTNDLAECNHIQGIAALVERVDSLQLNEWLLTAAQWGHVDVVRYLCELPLIDGVFPDVENNAALIDASECGHLEVVRYLCELPLDRGVDPGANNNEALLWAVRFGFFDIVRYLCELPLHRGVDPSAEKEGSSVLSCAAGCGRLNIVRYLCELPLERGVDPGAVHNAAIRAAAKHNQEAVVKYLHELPLERGVYPGACNNEALRYGAHRGFLNVVKFLCELPLVRGVDPSVRESEVLILAVDNGHLEIVRYLCELPLERGVNPGACENEALRHAAEGGHLEIVRYLCELPLERGVHPGACENEALRYAAEGDHLEMVKVLCELPLVRGVNPGVFESVVLRKAVRHDNLDLVRYLCELPPDRGVEPSAWMNQAIANASLATQHSYEIVRLHFSAEQWGAVMHTHEQQHPPSELCKR